MSDLMRGKGISKIWVDDVEVDLIDVIRDKSLNQSEWESLIVLRQLHKEGQLAGKVFDSLPIRTYHHRHCPGISRSGLSKVRKSVAHYLRGKDYSDSQALLVGKAVHAFVLEPDLFAKQFCIALQSNKRSTAGKAEFAAFESECLEKGISVLDQKTWDQVQAIGNSVLSHDAARALLSNGTPERSYFANLTFDFTLETSLVKARPDYVGHGDCIVELKTTSEGATMQEFRRSIARYHYDMQAALNLDVLTTVTGHPHTKFIFIVVEKFPPYAVGVYQINEAALEVGRELYRGALAKWHYYQQNPVKENEGLSPFVEPIDLPAYAFDLESR